jgi:hypothetical protein
LQVWNLCSYLKALRACPLQDKEIGEFSMWPSSWKIILELMTANAIISEVDVLSYVILSKEEKHVSHGELVGTTECMIL